MRQQTRIVAGFGMMLLLNQAASPDASYQSSSQMTGGTLLDMLQSSPFASLARGLTAPNNSLTMVHGNLKAVVTRGSTEIIDLDKETITRIDSAKKTYTVITFDQMRQVMAKMPNVADQQAAAMKQMEAQRHQTDLKTSFEVSSKNTGATKVINGLSAREQLITLQMHVTDPNKPAPDNSATYTVTTDVWVAPDPPEVKAMQDFDLRMGKKMMAGMDLSALAASARANASAMAALFASQPGAGEAWTQMGKEMAKVKGTRVLEVTSMSGNGGGARAGGKQAAASGALMTMTLQKSNFSHETVPSYIFQVPSGFKKMPSPFEHMPK